MQKRIIWIMWMLSLICFVQTAYADAGLPMIVVMMPGLIFLLIPIILIEAWVVTKYLRVKFSKTILGATIGNVVSTIIGIPLTWLLLVIVEFLTAGGGVYPNNWWGNLISVTLQAPWMLPQGSHDYWKGFVAMSFLMIPFFFISWLIERFFLKITLEKSLRPQSSRASFYANLVSYAFLEICLLILFIVATYGGTFMIKKAFFLN